MAIAGNPYAEYKKTQIETATPEQLILMLYDGAIKFLVQAKIKINNKDPKKIEECNNSLMRAQDIIYELIKSLDMERGGDIAQNLFSLYEFMLHQLMEANMNKDPKPITVVLSMIKDLRDTWTEVMKIQQQESQTRQLPQEKSRFCISI